MIIPIEFIVIKFSITCNFLAIHVLWYYHLASFEFLESESDHLYINLFQFKIIIYFIIIVTIL